MQSAREVKTARPSQDPSDPAMLAYACAQDFWGLGNLSPLDHLFGSMAVMRLVPPKNSNLAFLGRHLGQRLHRYAEDTGTAIDAFETEPVLSHYYKKKKSPVRLKPWAGGPALLKKGRYASAVALQACEIGPSVGSVYEQCAAGTKPGGRIFAADMIHTEAGQAAAVHYRPEILSVSVQRNSLRDAGFAIEDEVDLTGGLITAIRSGFLDSLKTLSEAKSSAGPQDVLRLAAYAAQLRIWGTAYALAQKKILGAVGFLAVKR